MGAQSLGRRVIARQLGLGQGGMDLLVAQVMQQDHGATLAALQPGHQMMQRLWHPGRNGAQAERTNRINPTGSGPTAPGQNAGRAFSEIRMRSSCPSRIEPARCPRP